jgi:lauroyl/myristoyl acyltransferase
MLLDMDFPERLATHPVHFAIKRCRELLDCATRVWRAINASGRGITFLTGHLGAWELLSFTHSALEQPISFLVFPIDNPRVEEYVELIRTGDDKQDIEVNTALLTSAIERMVRKYPDQWLWIHKRWKTRPAGEPDLYSDL